VAPGKTKPGLELGNLGATDRDPMRRRAIELDHRAVPFLAHEADMRDRYDMAAVHPDEQAGIELCLGLRNRPWAHALAGAVMDPGIMSIGPDAAHVSRIDEVCTVGALDRQPNHRRGARRLADATQRGRNHPLTRGRALIRFGREYADDRGTGPCRK